MVERFKPAVEKEPTFNTPFAVMINHHDGKFVRWVDYHELETRVKDLENILSLSFVKDLMNGKVFNGYKFMPVVATNQMASQAAHITDYARNVWSLMVSTTPSYNDAKGKYG
jgi:hypothetical protein